MGLFSHTKTVVGLFGSDQEAEKAVDRLFQEGIGGDESDDSVELLDHYRFSGLATERDAAVAMPAPTGSNNPIGLVPVSENAASDPNATRLAIKQELIDKGLDEGQAEALARKVARDGVLVVVETNGERADHVLDIIRQTGAQEVIG